MSTESYEVLLKLNGSGGVWVQNALIDVAGGDLVAGVILSQLVYWTPKATIRAEGHTWIAKSYKDWHDECRVGERTARRAISKLESLGLVVTKIMKMNGAPTVHIRIDPEGLSAGIDNQPLPMTDSMWPNWPDGSGQYGQMNVANMDDSYKTEITTEITTENPPTPPASPSAPQDYLSADAFHSAVMDGIVDSGALSPAAPEVYNEPSPVDEALSLLVEKYPEAKPRPALLDSNGKPHAWCRGLAVPQLVEVVDLSVCFSEATRDVGGNRYPNPFTKGACEPLRRLIHLDGFSAAQVRAMTGWVTQNEFWSSNVACTSKLREKWDQLRSQRNRDLKKSAEIRERDSGPADGTTEGWMIRSAHGGASDPSTKVDA